MLYGNPSPSFSGWKIDPSEAFGTNAWQPIRTPQVSDYVPSPPPALPKPSDYVPISKTEQPAAPPVSAVADTAPRPQTINGSREYSTQELQKIGSSSPREIAGFFQNLNGTTIGKYTDDDGISGIIYSNPALPDKSYKTTGENKGFWQIYTHTVDSGQPAKEGFVNMGTTRVTPYKEIQLSGSEIKAIIEQQNKPVPPQPEQPKPEETPLVQFGSNAVPITPLPVPQEKPAVERIPSIGSTIITNDIPRTPPEFKPALDTAAQTQPQPQSSGQSTAPVPVETPAPTAPPAPAAETPALAETQTDGMPKAKKEEDITDQVMNMFGNGVASVEAGLKNPHQKFLEDADKLKQQIDFKHNLASNLSHQIMQVEEGHIYDERKAYYAQNREAVNEAVEKLRTNAAELTEQHGEVKGKLYMVAGYAKMFGAIGTVMDAVELGKLSKTASETGDWTPVSDQINKMLVSAAAVGGITTSARFLAAGLMAAGMPAGFVVAGIAIGAAALTYYTLNRINKSFESNKEDSQSEDARSDSSHREYEYSDLVLFGDAKQYARPENIKLAAKNVTIIGNHHAENIEVESDTLTVMGTLDVGNNLKLDSNQIEMSNFNFTEPAVQEAPAENGNTVVEAETETPPQENGTEQHIPQPAHSEAAPPVLEAVAAIGTTHIGAPPEDTPTEAAKPERDLAAERARLGALVDLLSEDELYLPLGETGSAGLPVAVSAAENHTYADSYHTLPHLSGYQENALI